MWWTYWRDATSFSIDSRVGGWVSVWISLFINWETTCSSLLFLVLIRISCFNFNFTRTSVYFCFRKTVFAEDKKSTKKRRNPGPIIQLPGNVKRLWNLSHHGHLQIYIESESHLPHTHFSTTIASNCRNDNCARQPQRFIGLDNWFLWFIHSI